MKKTFRFLSMATLALVGAVMTSCSNEDDSVSNQQSENNSNVVTLTATVGFGGSTRALTSAGAKTFADGDEIAVIYKNTSGETKKAVGTIASGVGSSSATFTVTLTDPNKDAAIRYIYPEAISKSYIPPTAKIDDNGTVNFGRLDIQKGQLATLGNNLDLCTFDADNWSSGTLPTGTLANQLTILAIKLKKGDDVTSTITQMTINACGRFYNIEGHDSDGHIYVAIRPCCDYFTVSATDGSKYYYKHFANKVYSKNTCIQATWNMADEFWSRDETAENVLIGVSSFTLDNITWTGARAVEGDCFLPAGTFEAPSGKKFAKIEIFTLDEILSPWSYNDDRNAFTWTGSASSVSYTVNNDSDFYPEGILFYYE